MMIMFIRCRPEAAAAAAAAKTTRTKATKEKLTGVSSSLHGLLYRQQACRSFITFNSNSNCNSSEGRSCSSKQNRNHSNLNNKHSIITINTCTTTTPSMHHNLLLLPHIQQQQTLLQQQQEQRRNHGSITTTPTSSKSNNNNNNNNNRNNKNTNSSDSASSSSSNNTPVPIEQKTPQPELDLDQVNENQNQKQDQKEDQKEYQKQQQQQQQQQQQKQLFSGKLPTSKYIYQQKEQQQQQQSQSHQPRLIIVKRLRRPQSEPEQKQDSVVPGVDSNGNNGSRNSTNDGKTRHHRVDYGLIYYRKRGRPQHPQQQPQQQQQQQKSQPQPLYPNSINVGNEKDRISTINNSSNSLSSNQNPFKEEKRDGDDFIFIRDSFGHLIYSAVASSSSQSSMSLPLSTHPLTLSSSPPTPTPPDSVRQIKRFPVLDATALLHPKQYCTNISSNATTTKSGTDAARRLKRGKDDLLDVIRKRCHFFVPSTSMEEITNNSTSTANKNSSFVATTNSNNNNNETNSIAKTGTETDTISLLEEVETTKTKKKTLTQEKRKKKNTIIHENTKTNNVTTSTNNTVEQDDKQGSMEDQLKQKQQQQQQQQQTTVRRVAQSGMDFLSYGHPAVVLHGHGVPHQLLQNHLDLASTILNNNYNKYDCYNNRTEESIISCSLRIDNNINDGNGNINSNHNEIKDDWNIQIVRADNSTDSVPWSSLQIEQEQKNKNTTAGKEDVEEIVANIKCTIEKNDNDKNDCTTTTINQRKTWSNTNSNLRYDMELYLTVMNRIVDQFSMVLSLSQQQLQQLQQPQPHSSSLSSPLSLSPTTSTSTPALVRTVTNIEFRRGLYYEMERILPFPNINYNDSYDYYRFSKEQIPTPAATSSYYDNRSSSDNSSNSVSSGRSIRSSLVEDQGTDITQQQQRKLNNMKPSIHPVLEFWTTSANGVDQYIEEGSGGHIIVRLQGCPTKLSSLSLGQEASMNINVPNDHDNTKNAVTICYDAHYTTKKQP